VLMRIECNVVYCIIVRIQAWMESPLPCCLCPCVLYLDTKSIRDDVGVGAECFVWSDEIVKHDIVTNDEKFLKNRHKLYLLSLWWYV
jgi:hypothetical protein